MPFSLYAATIPSYQQILGAVSGLLGTILRWKGVRIGKRDFTGRLRTKPIAAGA